MDFINTREAAALAGVSVSTVRNLARDNDFAAPFRISPRKVYYERADIMAWIQARKLNIDNGA